MNDSAAATATIDSKAIGAIVKEAVSDGDLAALGRLAATHFPGVRGTTSLWSDSVAIWMRRAAVGA